MRPGQQNKRSRGRNGRKNTNPLSRNYESNGPDVKIRGNASHVAEKYLQLARDASSSGDLVMVENYLQHAEHYFRMISAAQAQFPQQQRLDQGQVQENFESEEGDEGDDHEIDGRMDGRMNGYVRETPRPLQYGQPEPNQGPAERSQDDRGFDRDRSRHHRRRGGEVGNPPTSSDPARAPQPPASGSPSEDTVPPGEDDPAAAK